MDTTSVFDMNEEQVNVPGDVTMSDVAGPSQQVSEHSEKESKDEKLTIVELDDYAK